MMTLLEAISPTARQLLMMPVVGISKSERHKIHAVRDDGQPLCGGLHGEIVTRLAERHRPNQLRRLLKN